MADNLSTLTLDVAGTISTSSVAGPKVVPFNADISDVIAAITTAPTGADLVFDVLKNGTSIFAASLGTIAALKNAQGVAQSVGTTDTTIYVEFANNVAPDIKSGAVLLIESEKMLVTAQVSGSSKVDGAQPVYAISVQRAYDGTSAATHAGGTSVLPAKPYIPAGASKSSLAENGALAQGAFQLAQGDVLTLSVSQVGSSVAGSGLSVSLELVQR